MRSVMELAEHCIILPLKTWLAPQSDPTDSVHRSQRAAFLSARKPVLVSAPTKRSSFRK
jgi:hypothetical protein